MEIRPGELVEGCYHDVWNNADAVAAREVLHSDLRFRASSAPVRVGPEGFIEYMRSIHAALVTYKCTLVDLVETHVRAAARVRFCGRQRGVFFGVPATGREIEWVAAAFFTVNGRKLSDIWVSGKLTRSSCKSKQERQHHLSGDIPAVPASHMW